MAIALTAGSLLLIVCLSQLEACPDDWQSYGNYCFYASNVRKNHSEARRACQRMLPSRSDLASITDQAEWKFVRDELSEYRYWHYWFGLYKKNAARGDAEPGVTTYWLDGNPSTFRKWYGNEPNSTAHCVLYIKDGFKDRACGHSHYFTCKMNNVTRPNRNEFHTCDVHFNITTSTNECSTSSTRSLPLSLIRFRPECNDHHNPQSCLQLLAICPPSSKDIINCRENMACWVPQRLHAQMLSDSRLCAAHLSENYRKYWIVINYYFINLGANTTMMVTEKTTANTDTANETLATDSITTMTVTQNTARNDDDVDNDDDGDITLTRGALDGIIAGFVLLLLLLIILIIVVIVLCRRSASSRARNAGNSHDSNAYELPSNANSQYTRPAVYSEVLAPAAESTNAAKPPDNGVAQPSAPPQRSSSLHDVTLVDNDLYE